MRRSGLGGGGNYPPGAKNDPRAPYNQPDHSHDHEWRPIDREQPIIEDGAAIFHEVCEYAEGLYGEGWECEEERSYRFEYARLEKPGGETVELHDITEWEENPETVREQVIAIEEAFHDGDATLGGIDPDPNDGQVSIEYDGYTLIYEP